MALWWQRYARGLSSPSSLPPPLISSDAHEQFNHVNSLSLIARAHQLVQEGYKYMFDEALATVWSAPNYCYRCGNMAAILTVRENGTRNFTVYGPAEENERDTAQQRTRRPVRCLFISCRRPEMLIRDFFKGKFTVFCVGVDQNRCRRIDFNVHSILLFKFTSTLCFTACGTWTSIGTAGLVSHYYMVFFP